MTLEKLCQLNDKDTYEFVLGWNMLNKTPDIACITLSDSSEYHSGHIAITGESGHGKGTLEQAILLQLAATTSTSQLRIQIIDPKRSDGALWSGKAHMWNEPVLGEDPQPIKQVFEALREERQRRDKLRTKYQVREWEELPAEIRPPRLVVWITELATLTKAIEKFDDWLEDELSKCRASGITYLIDLQNQSGKEMRWRTHIGTFVAGFQSSAHHIQPNIGLPASEIIQLGGMLPTELKRRQFVVRNKRSVSTIGAPTLSTADIQHMLSILPSRPSAPLSEHPIAQDKHDIEIMSSQPGDDIAIPAELWQQIVDTARRIEATKRNPSRADVFREIFKRNTPSGDDYTRVKRVCDAEGLLMPKSVDTTIVEPVRQMA